MDGDSVSMVRRGERGVIGAGAGVAGDFIGRRGCWVETR